MNDFHAAGFPDHSFFERPDALTHGLCSISNYQHDQLPVLLGHDLGLLHEGGSLALGLGGGRGLGLNVEVELGLELAKLVLHHALVVTSVIGTWLLHKQ